MRGVLPDFGGALFAVPLGTGADAASLWLPATLEAHPIAPLLFDQTIGFALPLPTWASQNHEVSSFDSSCYTAGQHAARYSASQDHLGAKET